MSNFLDHCISFFNSFQRKLSLHWHSPPPPPPPRWKQTITARKCADGRPSADKYRDLAVVWHRWHHRCETPHACSDQVAERLQGPVCDWLRKPDRFWLSRFEGSDDDIRFWTGFICTRLWWFSGSTKLNQTARACVTGVCECWSWLCFWHEMWSEEKTVPVGWNVHGACKAETWQCEQGFGWTFRTTWISCITSPCFVDRAPARCPVQYWHLVSV